MKKEKMLEENDIRREQDFSAKVNSNADKKLKKEKKSQRKTPHTRHSLHFLLSPPILSHTTKKLRICNESKKRSKIESREEIPRGAIYEGRMTMCLGNRPCSNSMNTFRKEKSTTTIEVIFRYRE